MKEIFTLRIFQKDDGTVESICESNFMKSHMNIAFTISSLSSALKECARMQLQQYDQVIDKENIEVVKRRGDEDKYV